MTGTVRISMPQRILLSPRTRGRDTRSRSAHAIRPYWTQAQRSTAEMSRSVFRSGTLAPRRTDTHETVATIVASRARPAMRRATARLCRPSWHEEKRTLGWTRRNRLDTSRRRAQRRLLPPRRLLWELTCAGFRRFRPSTNSASPQVFWIIFLPRGAWPACVPSSSGASPPLEPSRRRACSWRRPGTRCTAGTERRRAVCRSFRANDRASREHRHHLRAAGDGCLGRGFSLLDDDDLGLPAVRRDRGALWLAARVRCRRGRRGGIARRVRDARRRAAVGASERASGTALISGLGPKLAASVQRSRRSRTGKGSATPRATLPASRKPRCQSACRWGGDRQPQVPRAARRGPHRDRLKSRRAGRSRPGTRSNRLSWLGWLS